MNISSADMKKENTYLETVKKVANDFIDDIDVKVEKEKQDIFEIKKYIWDECKAMSELEYGNLLNDTDAKVKRTNDQIMQAFKYKKIIDNAYFGRVDFKTDEELINVYIGLHGLHSDSKNYIFDWRAPISSLFYNYTVGDAQYEAPKGTIKGEILTRRQYKIEDGVLERMIESDINIDDEVLQEVLANSSSDKMKNIVTTIQQEQNEIIRNNSEEHLIVQGVAGSGKTSVALHRIAYLLYQNEDLNSNNILIFSPNEVFAEYISEVLPTLGEDNVLNTTFSELAKEYTRKNNSIQTFTEFIEEYYNNDFDEFNFEINKFKLSDSFKNSIDQFLEQYISTHSLSDDIEMIVNRSKSIIIDKDEVNDLFNNRYNGLSIKERLNLISERICDLEQVSYSKCGASIRNALVSGMGITLDEKKLYFEFLNSDIYTSNFNFAAKLFNVKSSNIKYQDLIGILYLGFELNGYPYNTKVKHIVIDEAQDYSKLQFYIIKKMFPQATFTILGDINQTVNPYYKYDDLSTLCDIFGSESEYYELSKSYRSSPEVIDYANAILGLTDKPSVRHNSNLPIENIIEEDDLGLQLSDSISTMRDNGLKRIAIVTKNNTEALELMEQLESVVDGVSLATNNMSNDNVIIVPSYIAKGLEFDGVILYTKPDNYYSEMEKNLYYVVCTRAQHQLIIYNQPQLVLENQKTLQKK